MSYALNARWGMTAECDLTKSHLEYLGAKLFQSKSMVSFFTTFGYLFEVS